MGRTEYWRAGRRHTPARQTPWLRAVANVSPCEPLRAKKIRASHAAKRVAEHVGPQFNPSALHPGAKAASYSCANTWASPSFVNQRHAHNPLAVPGTTEGPHVRSLAIIVTRQRERMAVVEIVEHRWISCVDARRSGAEEMSPSDVPCGGRRLSAEPPPAREWCHRGSGGVTKAIGTRRVEAIRKYVPSELIGLLFAEAPLHRTPSTRAEVGA